MAHLFKQRITRPVPDGAELFMRNGERFARWTDGKGKKRVARVTGEGGAARLVTESGTWYARITLANGSRVDVSTGCRDKGAAASRMAEMVAEQEKIRAGVITQNEANTATHGRRGYAGTVDAFAASMTARGCTADHVAKTGAYLKSAGNALGWATLRDMDRAELERWLAMRAITPKEPPKTDDEKPARVMGARVHNAHAAAFSAFGNWCLRQGYTKGNPFAGMQKRNERADRRHVRRAFTADELARLIEAARVRPVQDALKGNSGRGKAMKA
ncbi:MAG: hypothetical protein GX580_01830, partial [Candidatus Hydrogenedens sp.]|nr:hypothetical protein [Candidatus Hydrogenedens sp.]